MSFWKGVIVGNLLSTRDAGSSSGGCLGCFAMIFGLGAFILVLYVGVYLLLIGNQVVGGIRDFLSSAYEYTIIKVLFFPSTFDLTLGILSENPIMKVFVFTVVFFFLLILVMNLDSLPKIIAMPYRIISVINIAVLPIRLLFYIFASVIVLFIGSENYSTQYSANSEITFNTIVKHPGISYRYYQGTEEEMPDFNLELHKNFFWVDFDNKNENLKEIGQFKTELFIKGFFFDEIKDADEFKAVVSYVPEAERYTHTNQSKIVLEFIGDGGMLEKVEISPENPMVKINIRLEDIEKFEISITSDMQDRSILGMFDPCFIKYK